MQNHLIITLIAEDRPGIIERLANTISQHQGNWRESSLSRLAGKFVGIVSCTISDDQLSSVTHALEKLSEQGIRISIEIDAKAINRLSPSEQASSPPPAGQPLQLYLTGNDRPGIVAEISTRLARLNVNVEKLHTSCENAPMTGELLFNLRATLQLPLSLNQDQVRENLEELSDDLVVEIAES